MNKAEFLHILEKRLQVLNKKERDDILSEYSQHIDMRVESGLNEEEAIKDFGDFDELASEILEAYNLNPNYNKNHIDSEEITKKVTGAFSKFFDILNETIKRFKVLLVKIPNQSSSSIIKLVLLILGIIFVYLFSLPVLFEVASFVYDIFPHILDNIASLCIIIAFHIIYAVLSITLLYTFIMNQKEKTSLKISHTDVETITPVKNKFIKSIHTPINITKQKGDEEKMEISLIRPIIDFFSVIFKFIVICCLIPIVFCVFGSVIGLGLLLILCFMGYPLIGITICTLGAAACGITFIWFIWDVFIKNKED